MLYALKLPRPQFWGDYGTVLAHGMVGEPLAEPTLELDREAQIELERVGPYIPSLTLPSMLNVVVTDRLRKEIEDLRLAQVSFRLVIKDKIVSIPWHTWDRSKMLPTELLPPSMEPEDFIFKGVHSQSVSDEIGDLWQVVMPRVNVARAQEYSWCRIEGKFWTYIDERVLELLNREAAGWFKAQPFLP
jgi:hypothetical protein